MSSTSPNRNRRQFLSQASFAVASMGVVGLPRPWMMAPQSPAAAARDKTAIQRTLGRTGIELPIVSMGVMNANNPELLKAAYEAGVRLFDTALGYQQGRNERMVGDVGCCNASGSCSSGARPRTSAPATIQPRTIGSIRACSTRPGSRIVRLDRYGAPQQTTTHA